MMADNDLGNHELMRELDNAPAPNPPTVADDQPQEAKVPDRDESGRFARKSEDEAPEAPEDLEASAEDADESADEGESDDESNADDEQQEERPKKKTPWSQRVRQLTAEKHQLRGQLEAASRERQQLVEFLKQEIDPSLEFENPAQFTQAIIERSLAKQQLRQNEQQIAAASQAEYAASLRTFFDAVEDFRTEMPDFDDVIENAAAPIPREVVSMFAESEIGPKIAYHIAKHPAVQRQLSRFVDNQGNLTDPIGYAREFGKLEARLSAPPPKRTTKAPKPARPISANGTAGTFDPSSSSVDDFKKQIFG